MQRKGLTIAISLLLIVILSTPSYATIKFSDVPEKYWASDEIEFLAKSAIIQGYSNGKFAPNSKIKRMEMAIMIAKAKQISLLNSQDPQLKDLKANDKNYDIVKAVMAEGYFDEVIKNHEFLPNKYVTRAEMATILARAYDLKGTSSIVFKDVHQSSFAHNAIQALAKNQISLGYPDQTFRPNELITRAQFSVFMAKTLNGKYKINVPVEQRPAVDVIFQLVDSFNNKKEINQYTSLLVMNEKEKNELKNILQNTDKNTNTSIDELTFVSFDSKKTTITTKQTTITETGSIFKEEITYLLTKTTGGWKISNINSIKIYKNNSSEFSPADVLTKVGKGDFGNKDADSASSTFRLPSFATTFNGQIFISDTQNQLIRTVSKDGKVSTFSGIANETDSYGLPKGDYLNGDRKIAKFNQPKGLVFDKQGNLYIVDSGNNAIRKIDPNGTVTTLVDGLSNPTDIVINDKNELFVSDTLNHRIIKVLQDGKMSTFAGHSIQKDSLGVNGGYKDGEDALFNEPTGLEIDRSGNLFVADSGNQRIRKITSTGNVTTIAGSGTEIIPDSTYHIGGYKDGKALEAQFNFPNGLTIANNGNLYIADTFNHRIRMLTKEGTVETVAGDGENGKLNDKEVSARFDGPSDLIVDENGNILVVDQFNNSLREIKWVDMTNSSGSTQVIWKAHEKVISKTINNVSYSISFDVQQKTIYLKKSGVEIASFSSSSKELSVKDYEFIKQVILLFEENANWSTKNKTILIRD
ncbi:S-layer homology domain-containing protein [Bacillus sp. CGMCC 1.16607]|uniref:S-layer homology domain-containing protein n=1 Tax=Bacillus sp. CGMCC 1.16607 TaxID=3351842 RepID=UPI0036459DDC